MTTLPTREELLAEIDRLVRVEKAARAYVAHCFYPSRSDLGYERKRSDLLRQLKDELGGTLIEPEWGPPET